MPLLKQEWSEILTTINRQIAKIGKSFTQDEVVKSDKLKMLVWTKEYGDTPIPIVAFQYEVKVWDTQPAGLEWEVVTGESSTVAIVKTQKLPTIYKVTPVVPKPGEQVLIARLLGSRRLLRCLGVIQADPKDYKIQVTED